MVTTIFMTRNELGDLLSLTNNCKKLREKWTSKRFTISSLLPQVSRSVMYEIVTECLHYRKLCWRWVPKMLTEVHKTEGVFLNYIVISDVTWVAYITSESKKQSLERRHSTSPKKLKLKQTIPTQKITVPCFERGRETPSLPLFCQLFASW